MMERKSIASLPHGFYKATSSPIKTVGMLKGQAKGTDERYRKSNTVIDLENNISQTAAHKVIKEDLTWFSVCLHVVFSFSSTY